MQPNFEEDPTSILEYWKILKRRRYLFWIPVIGIIMLAVYYAISLPPIYRSEATVLIEDQEVSKAIVGAGVAMGSQQVQLVSQRILTVSNIVAIVEKFNVYGRRRPDNPVPPTTLANKFRKHTKLDFVSAEIGESDEVAVAFTLAFESSNPKVSHEVAQELAKMFLEENRRGTASRTTDVSLLLLKAIDEANEELLDAEAKLAAFKAENEGALPELYELNLSIINRAEQQLTDVDLRIQQLQQRTFQLSAQLAPISPNAAVTLPSGETIMSDRERLRALLIDYRRKMAIYESGHPDLVRLEREIKNLQRSVGDIGTNELLKEQLRQERERLSLLRERYSEDHPDIQRSKAAISEIESQMLISNRQDELQLEAADNPAYVLISTQLQSIELELQNLYQKRTELRSLIAEHERLIARAPQVEMEYGKLVRSYDNSKTKYEDLQARLRAADLAADVGQETTGKRFTLIEPPVLPIRPDGPNRIAIVVMGIVFAFGVGAMCIVFAELADKTIRDAKKLSAIAGSPPLAVIPYISNRTDIVHARKQWFFLITALLVIGISYYILIRPFL
jgi:uncharacterized protein involved in exopolysaccharide biosynthesis